MTIHTKYKAQVVALPVKGKPGDYQVMLVTSRETRRWIMPKGWPMKGRKDHEAAAREALEEAGVSGHIHRHPMGAYASVRIVASTPIRSGSLTAASSAYAPWSTCSRSRKRPASGPRRMSASASGCRPERRDDESKKKA